MLYYYKFFDTDYWEVTVPMNGDLIFHIVSVVAGCLSITSFISAMCTTVLRSKKREKEALRILEKQLLELKAMQDSFDDKKLNQVGQDKSEETEKLINEIAIQLKQYQEKIEKRA